MKTAISIPEKVYKSAEDLANRLGKSRSQLYTQAISSYVEKHNNECVTKKLNEVYALTDSRLDKSLRKLQARSINREKW